MTSFDVRTMLNVVETGFAREEFLAALRKLKITAQGAKPATALRELKVPVNALPEEQRTWHELLRANRRNLRRLAAEHEIPVQEYGASNPELLAELSSRSRALSEVPVYQWALPEDLQPLREEVLGLLNGMIDVGIFRTAMQVIHLFQVAEQMGVAE
jgi:uroporphyrinogen-III synthase